MTALHIVVMGVAGTGKTTIGPLVAEALGLPYAEGDDFHPAANVAKMSAGVPLDDTDRGPWLDAIGEWAHGRDGTPYSQLGAITGVAYLLGLALVRWRS